MAESIGAIAWECDAASRQLTYVSAPVARLFGYPPEQWLKPGYLAEVVHPDDQARCGRIIQAAAAARQGFVLEARIIANGGDVRVVRASAQYVGATESRPPVFQGVLVDLTERRT